MTKKVLIPFILLVTGFILITTGLVMLQSWKKDLIQVKQEHPREIQLFG